jgi:membrane associated rhomboid family serine protease
MTATPPDEHKLRRATRIAWLGCGGLGVVFVGLGTYSAIASATTADESMRTPDVLMAVIGVVFGAITVVGAFRLRRRDSSGVRFASVILRFVLVVAAGNLVFSVVNGIGDNLGHFLWALIATVVTAALVGALEQLKTALTPPPPPHAGR